MKKKLKCLNLGEGLTDDFTLYTYFPTVISYPFSHEA